jgi:hypothetical protein
MAVRGRPPNASWSGVLFTDVRDCVLKFVGVPVNFPVKSWFAPYKCTQRQASISQFARKAATESLSCPHKAVCQRVSLSRGPCDTTCSPRSTVEEEYNRKQYWYMCRSQEVCFVNRCTECSLQCVMVVFKQIGVSKKSTEDANDSLQTWLRWG